MSKRVIFRNLGRIRYKQAWDLQEQLFQEVIAAKINGAAERPQYLLFCEHEPVYTLGKSGDAHNLLITENMCKAKNIDYYPINRGGDITYHGPGQLVAYPIIDMEAFGVGVKMYIQKLEDVIIRSLEAYGIAGQKDDKAMGVWLDVENPTKARKICAIGVRTSRFVTMHGFALNVNTDLNYFNHINPCGFTDKGVTSIQKELGHAVDMPEVEATVQKAFREVFGMEFVDEKQAL